jgi:hypothetical protein
MIVVAMLFPKPSNAQGHIEASVNDPAKLVSRTTPRPGRSIITQNGDAALLLNDTAVVIQMTDEALRSINRNERSEEKSGMARLVGAMVMAGVKEMLDRGISYPLSALDYAKVDDGKLVLVARNGELIFDSMNINNTKPMHDFDESDAKDFAKRINAATRRLHR